ncbi:hypothetical protein NRIC_01580 [Enterococcus florum]|uniref:Rhodanese domain-containing protein n=1 Tax=Enterococcus florum TaxID=2480627 RepID=A0A4P5P3F9_9ENTE|nr:rhodanese-like domain-containing protein [Enterococcus florum]GCF92267.1 hypothetical protein NRIC_01580 [Enterococcus florum]
MKSNIGLFILVILSGLVLFAGCSTRNAKKDQKDIDWQYITPKKMKQVIEEESSGSYQIMDIQPEAEYQRGHLPNSISVAAYPVDTKELEQKVVDQIDVFENGTEPIYVVCPGGGSGAQRAIFVMVHEGIDESRFYIVEDGAKKWPYKSDELLWVTNE